jgi:hypothetical protein
MEVSNVGLDIESQRAQHEALQAYLEQSRSAAARAIFTPVIGKVHYAHRQISKPHFFSIYPNLAQLVEGRPQKLKFIQNSLAGAFIRLW